MAAISSSAWMVVTPKCLNFDSSCKTSLAGVIGYAPSVSSSPLSSVAAIKPQAVAWLPPMLRYLPLATGALGTS